MKLGKQLAVTGFLSLWMISATAQTYEDPQSSTDQKQQPSDLSAYVQNWAALLGYNVTTPPEAAPTASSTQLTNYAAISLTELLLYSSFFGSIPTVTPPNSGGGSNSSTVIGGTFVPSNDPAANLINNNSNLTFQNFGNMNQSGSNVTVSNLMDQPPYQSDPTSQALFNILGTPDVSYCTQSNGSVANATNPNTTPASCSRLGNTMFQTQVVENIIGTLPDQNSFYSFNTNQAVLAQLNSNSLIAPLMYSTDANTTSTNSSQNGESAGLSAQNQLQQANNFIRYVSGAVNPIVLPNLSAYQTLYNQAITKTTSDPAGLAQAQATLSTYLTNIRIYAAQSSVGLGNLYYILSRRLPQQKQLPAGAQDTGQQGTSNLPSQAFNEYAMATWRIFNPKALSDSNGNSSPQQNQWIDKINNATPATVQKEMAILLSEINYQLYLSRQIQERILLTNSVSLLQGTKAAQPNADLSNQSTKAPAGASTDSAN